MQFNRKIIDSYKITLGYIGILTMIIGGMLLLPLLVLVAYPDELRYAINFIIPAAIALLIGYLLSFLIRGEKNHKLTLRQDTVIVVSVWLMATFFSALPFMLSGQLNFTQAYFEAVSGWTTTGLSVVDVTVTPKVYLLHRSIMQFFGGVGLVLVMLSALSGTYGMRLYNAEGHSDKLLPNLAKSARIIMSIYAGYVLAGVILYVTFGMPWFDAINHSIGALSTGGFSTQTDSIGAYKSFPIELITIILMLLGTINFAAHLLLIKGKFRNFFRVGEIRFMFAFLGFSIPIAAFVSLNGIYGSVSEGFRISAFQLVSALTTTGFSTVTYNSWSPFSIFIMIIAMLIGGGTGSTAGGIKQNRIYLMVKAFYWNLKRKFLPEHLVHEDFIYRPEGKVYIDQKHLTEVYNFTFIYMVLFFLGVSVLVAYGYSLQDSLFEFASSLGTVGLSVGVTLPTTPSVVLWTEIVGMLFGRLEIYVILIAVIKFFKDAKSIVVTEK
ncbi:TrkH family potassium uptake protein [Desulfosporosinus fructosivorans]|uniref:TrkH family potassium uptake protein n=1 Tax=Desulfosporosinus fructosivorans TaxID=2018669 RepID=A0A4Z0R0K0_9FIRM|nr:TrkH family potassium uptake protein [Desulfosporosinus fructosivorans]TGE35146.1 TrkH family potassium uptake protein [Desulfosporosinus fructosivorans]